METENIWAVVTENPGIEVRIVKKLFPDPTAKSEAQR
jgi:hypothetical protein